MKKLIALVLALALVLASCAVAFADTNDGGSITVTNAEIGKKYELYKLFDATVNPAGAGTTSGISYTLPAGKSVPTAGDTFYTYFDIVNGNVVKQSTLTETVLKSAEFKTWAKSFAGSALKTETATTGTVEFTGLDYGYYFIESYEPDGNGGFQTTSGAILTVDSANPTASVIDKNQTITFDKNIVSGSDLVKQNQAGLNIDVPFDITVKSKNYDGDAVVFKYVIYDTLENGWTLKAAPVVKVGGNTLAATAYTISYKDKNSAATTDLAKAQYFEIEIPWTSDGTKTGTFLYNPNDEIKVTYTAKLDPAKAADVHVGTTPNLNTAQVKYFKGNDTPTTPSGDLGTKITKTWETELTITKVDQNNQILKGAEFTLSTSNGTKVSYVYETKYVQDNANGTYYLLKDGTYTSEAPNSNETHDAVYASTTDKYKMVKEAVVKGEGQTATTISSYVDANGEVKFSGLGTGTYKIEETVVPAGYNKAADIEFTIGFAVDSTTNPQNPVGKFSLTNCTPTGAVTLNATNNVFEATIQNNKGTELPSTGGIGTTIFYIVGGLLVIGAAVILVARRKASN